MKRIVYKDGGWWIVWRSTGNKAWLHWRGPYRWRWIAIYKRWLNQWDRTRGDYI